MSSIEKAMRRQSAAEKQKKKSSSIIEGAIEKQSENELQQHDVTSSSAQQVAETNTEQQETLTASEQAAESLEQPEGSMAVTGEQVEQDDTPVEADAGVNQDNELKINFDELESKGFVTMSKRRTLINEEYRSIKRKLLNNAFGAISRTIKRSNLILVSSSKPNEGKTFTAVNLALSIALEQDKTVLLVDSDVLKPSVAKTLGIGNNNVGLIEYLLGEVPEVGSIIYRTNIERLRVIPAGLPHHLSNELLSSDKMMNLLEEFASRYPDRIVVFDAPPLLGVNETSVMAEQCGQGVIVVEEHKSKINDVKQAVELLPDEMAVGFVLNKVTSPSDTQGYGYYYSSSSNVDE